MSFSFLSSEEYDEQAHQLNALIDRCTKEHLEIHRQSYAVTLLGRSRRGSD